MLSESIMKMYVLERDVLAFNATAHTGIIMTFNEYKQCKHLTDFALCNAHHLMRNLSTTDDCIVATYFNATDRDSDCRLSRVQLRNQLWIELANPNVWIYVMPNFTVITVQYSSNREKALTLHGVGMLKLLQMCHVRSMDVLLQYVPQLGGTKMSIASDGFSLPVTITREQSLIISGSSNDNSRIIPVGKSTEAQLSESSRVAGIYREPGNISPWIIVGIVFAAFFVLLAAMHVFLREFAIKRRLRTGQQELQGMDSSQQQWITNDLPSANASLQSQ